MSLQPITPEKASQYSILVNNDRIRSSVRRLFHNRIAEVASELFQNSQRAGATLVIIDTTASSFTITDNGHGLLNGVDGFHTLLKLAESNFDNPTIEDQDPLGIGCLSLLTHDQIREVTFASGSLQLTINTKRWWEPSNKDYYSTWYERLEHLDQPVHGLRITVGCEPPLVKELKTILQPKEVLNTFLDSHEIFECASPAQGYAGILNITLDGDVVRTTLPSWADIKEPLIVTRYKDADLKIAHNNSGHETTIRWYGQLIRLGTLRGPFAFHLDVRSGRPVNPLSPTRMGLIEDAAYHDLLSFVKEKIFSFVFDIKNRGLITPDHVVACFKIDQARALKESPYLVAKRLLELDNPNSFDDLFLQSTNELFTYSQAPPLLRDSVTIVQQNDVQEAEYGLSSFVPAIGPAYTLQLGDESKLPIGELWWKPKGKAKHRWFCNPGSYGISFTAHTQPLEWKPITATTVFTFSDPQSHDASEVDFTVGTEDMMAFMHNQVWTAFSPSEDYDAEPQEESYRESIEAIIRSIIGKCVPGKFDFWDLKPFLVDKDSPITNIAYHYQQCPNGKFIKTAALNKFPEKSSLQAAAITVHTADGNKVRLKLH